MDFDWNIQRIIAVAFVVFLLSRAISIVKRVWRRKRDLHDDIQGE